MFLHSRDIEGIASSPYRDDKFVKVDCVSQPGLKHTLTMENLILHVQVSGIRQMEISCLSESGVPDRFNDGLTNIDETRKLQVQNSMEITHFL